MTINDGFESDDALQFDWPAIRIGTGQYEDGPTGVTVIHFPERAFVAMDVRGGGPGTINSDYIDLAYPLAELDAIVISGGTFFGLETATAVNTALLDDGIRSSRWDNIGVVLGSIVYDMGERRLNEIYPDKRLAQAALRAAQAGIFPNGAYGAGRSTLSGSLFGCNAHSGQGAAFRQIGDLKIAAFVVVNALGVVVDRQGQIVACHKGANWPETITANELLAASPDSLDQSWDGALAGPQEKNTTISVIVTNRKLTQVELQRLATQVHTSMARAIQPFATEFDGDVLYAVSTGEIDADAQDMPAISLGVVAGEVMWDAILASTPPQPEIPQGDADGQPGKAELDIATGTYRAGRGAQFEVWSTNGQLFAKAVGDRSIFALRKGSEVALVPTASGTFTARSRYPFELRFESDRVVINPGRWQQVAYRLASE